MLESGKDHEAITAVHEQTVYIATLSSVPWLFKLIVNSMELLTRVGIRMSFNVFLDWCTQQVEIRRKVSVLHPRESTSTRRCAAPAFY